MKCLNPIRIPIDPDSKYPTYRYVPCGKCEACLTNKRREWLYRLRKELEHSISAYFITLTYDDDHLPRDGLLSKRDVQLFFKRFRMCINPFKVRYFLVGEYGETFGRPHYHLLLFNFPPTKNLSDALIKSWPWCSKSQWSLPGVIGDVSEASINYCAKYCVANLDNVPKQYRTFCMMSRRPGIGFLGLTDDYKEYFRRNGKLQDTIKDIGGYILSLPRYYRDKIFTDEEKVILRFNKDNYEAKENLRWQRKYGSSWPLQRREILLQKCKQIRERVKSSYYSIDKTKTD